MLNIHFTNHNLSHKPTEQFKVTDDSSPIVSNGDYQEKPQMKMVLQVSQKSLIWTVLELVLKISLCLGKT